MICSRYRHQSNQINGWWWNGLSPGIIPFRTRWRYSGCWNPYPSILTGGSPYFKMYTVSTVLFHKYVGANVAVKNCISQFSIFFPTKATVKMANGNTVHTQWIGIILCHFTNCSIIYPVGPVYYFPGHPSNTISSGALEFYIGF